MVLKIYLSSEYTEVRIYFVRVWKKIRAMRDKNNKYSNSWVVPKKTKQKTIPPPLSSYMVGPLLTTGIMTPQCEPYTSYKCWIKEEHYIRNLEWRICPRRLPV
jgi:hypothetical protein